MFFASGASCMCVLSGDYPCRCAILLGRARCVMRECIRIYACARMAFSFARAFSTPVLFFCLWQTSFFRKKSFWSLPFRALPHPSRWRVFRRREYKPFSYWQRISRYEVFACFWEGVGAGPELSNFQCNQPSQFLSLVKGGIPCYVARNRPACGARCRILSPRNGLLH